MDDTPDGGIFRSLPGADYILGARLLVLSLFFIVAKSFLLPAKRKHSGERVHARVVLVLAWLCVSERVATSLAETPFISLHSVHLKVANKSSQWAKKQNAKKRKEGKGSNHALRCIANTWVKVTFAMWSSKTPYDESKHLASIANHILNQPSFILGG